MTWSKFLTGIRQSFQRSPRNAKIGCAILHHGATTSDKLMIDMMVFETRQVSATAVVKDGRRTGVVDEDWRPWTSASPYWDGRSCTIECANESTNGWTISDASYESMAILLADWSRRYKFPLIRNGRNSTVFGHKELYIYFGDSYATACPGGMDVDRVVRRANQILASTAPAGGTTQPTPIDKEIEMALAARYVYRTEPTIEYMLLDEDLPPLPNDSSQRGYRISTNRSDGEAFGVLAGNEKGAPLMGLTRDKYVKVQEWARRLYDQKHA